LLKRQRANYYQKFPNEAPSSVAQPAKFKDVRHDPDIQMFCNRPCSATSNPVTLLYPIFGEFYDDSMSSELDPKISSFVLELAMMMCDFYDDEDKHTEAFRELIWNHFMIKPDMAKAKFPMATRLLDSMFISTPKARMKLEVHRLIQLSSPPYTITITYAIKQPGFWGPDSHVYTYTISARNPTFGRST
jgi:hypothetical protein